MKVSEAVHILRMIQDECEKQHMDSEAEALQMAIKTFSWTHENGQDSKKVDLIDRQAALDMEFSNGISEDGVLYVPYREVKMNLEDLPSAQPEVTEEAVEEYCRKRCLCIVDSALLKKYASAQPERKKDIIQTFHDYQIEWLTNHYDLALEPQLGELIVRFLHDTANMYMLEMERRTDETD